MKYDIKQGDCLELMKNIPDGSIDMILCDLPYGTTACKWDTVIPFGELWKEYDRIIKEQGVIALFCKQPFTTELIHSNLKKYKYSLVWKKDNHDNPLMAKKDFLISQKILQYFTKNNAHITHKGLYELIKLQNKAEGKVFLKKMKEIVNTSKSSLIIPKIFCHLSVIYQTFTQHRSQLNSLNI